MKKIIKYVMLLSIIVTSFSCDEKEWLQPDIELTPVFELTNISGAEVPVAINIYQDTPLIVEYQNDVLVSEFSTENYMDLSTELMYEISVDKLVRIPLINNGYITEIYTYIVNADKLTGAGILKIISEDGSELEHTITILEKEIYN